MSNLDPRRTPEAALDHVLYEMEMLLATFCHLRKLPEANRFERNVCLECFIVHARNLAEFINGSTNKDTITLLAFDLKIVPAQLQAVATDITRMHKEVCHLGFERKTGPTDGNWDLNVLIKAFVKPCLGFLEEIAGREDLLASSSNYPKRVGLLREKFGNLTQRLSENQQSGPNSSNLPIFPVVTHRVLPHDHTDLP